MAKAKSSEKRLPKGVTELSRPRGGRKFRAAIRSKGIEVHLGLYETKAIAAFAFNVASVLIGRGAIPPNEIPHGKEPSAEDVRTITSRIRRRLGLDRDVPDPPIERPSAEALLTFLEITVVGFWRHQAAIDSGDAPGRSLDAAAARILEAARLLLWDPRAGTPRPEDALTDLLARRIDSEFRRPDLTREILSDDGDDPWLVARWLAHPESSHSGRGFREEVRHLYSEYFEAETDSPRSWPDVLGLTPPFHPDQIRNAYRTLSKQAHPDRGGSPAQFVRLNAAYEQALAYLRARGDDA
ncbi:MAG: DnaJ-like protein [Planctomycetota bacterium]|nr:DnaJ-like protein [Planctomycetota bacterium]